jgi:hypothetical protein
VVQELYLFIRLINPLHGASLTNQILLIRFVYTKPCCTIANGVATFALANGNKEQAINFGDAVWGRVTDSAGNWVADYDVTLVNGSGVIQIDAITLYTGGSVVVVTHTISLA